MTEEKINIDNMEIANSNDTPKKLKLWRKIVRVVSIVFIITLLTLSYWFLFSGYNIEGLTSSNYVGVIKTENFENANFGDLLVVREVKKVKNIEVGDIIVYQINGVVYSREVKEKNTSTKIITVIENQEEKNVAFNVVLGVQEKNIAVLGLFWGFLASYVGVIVLSIGLLAYVFYITFSRIDYEDTKRGEELLSIYKKQQKEYKHRKKLIRQFKKSDGFSPEDSNIIDGDIGDNLIELIAYTNAEKKGDVSETYDYILDKVYNVYMFKGDLSKSDKQKVSNVVELCGIVRHFDEDITYKLIDLLLLESLHDFDDFGFSKLALKFLYKEVGEDDLINFGSMLYVLLIRNPKLKKSTIIKVVSKYIKKVNERKTNNELLTGLTDNFFTMFKTNADIKKLKLK